MCQGFTCRSRVAYTLGKLRDSTRSTPDDPLDAAPELKARLPEAPFEPASTDFTTTLPLEVAVPDPVLKDT